MAALRHIIGACKIALGLTSTEEHLHHSGTDTSAAPADASPKANGQVVKLELQSIVTAFELLTGQGGFTFVAYLLSFILRQTCFWLCPFLIDLLHLLGGWRQSRRCGGLTYKHLIAARHAQVLGWRFDVT